MSDGGFMVYIDESGDEGFVFTTPGSSHWFVLSAVVTRRENDMEAVRLVDAVRALLKRHPRKALHFRDLQHHHRVPYVDAISKAKLRTVTVLIHKPSLAEPEKFRDGYLYRYACRYLLERVSWLCRDHRKKDGDKAKIIFSNRSCMSYDDLRAYMSLLRAKSAGDIDVRLDWSVLDPSMIEAQTHDSMMGLQIADAVASSMFSGVEVRLGHTEPRYATMLRPTIYKHNGKQLGYGFKLWPASVCPAPASPELGWIAQAFR